ATLELELHLEAVGVPQPEDGGRHHRDDDGGFDLGGLGEQVLDDRAQILARLAGALAPVLEDDVDDAGIGERGAVVEQRDAADGDEMVDARGLDRKSTRLNSSHRTISYAVFCLK